MSRLSPYSKIDALEGGRTKFKELLSEAVWARVEDDSHVSAPRLEEAPWGWGHRRRSLLGEGDEFPLGLIETDCHACGTSGDVQMKAEPVDLELEGSPAGRGNFRHHWT